MSEFAEKVRTGSAAASGGAWSVRAPQRLGDSFAVVDAGGEEVCRIVPWSDEVDAADAAFIAMAPEMATEIERLTRELTEARAQTRKAVRDALRDALKWALNAPHDFIQAKIAHLDAEDGK